MRIEVPVQRSVVRHIAQTAMSNRAIGLANNVSPTTVSELRWRFEQTELPWEALATLPDEAFTTTLGTQRNASPSGKFIPDWSVVAKEMELRDMTLALLYEEYLAELESEKERSLCYSHFTALFRAWKKTQRISMRQFHRAGDKMFVDFCGKTMPITDPTTGEEEYVQIFVSVLGASGYTFAYAVPTQRVGDWTECNVKAFEFYGGAPRHIVTDNLKSAVIKNTKAHIVLNRCYADMAEHYGSCILPARSRKPKDKSLAEVMVQIVQRWVLAPLRKRRFFSIDELNKEILKGIHLLNAKTSKTYKKSRLQRFEELDRFALRPLPAERFELSQWRYNVRVPEDYHVEYMGSQYSVPYQYAHNMVDLRASSRMLEVILGHQRIASHALRTEPGVSTLQSHMPISHQEQARDEPDALMEWARKIGPETLGWVQKNLLERRDFANGLRAVCRLRHWVREEQNTDRLESACACATQRKRFGFEDLKSIITKNTDLKPRPDNTAWVRQHANIRGADYFRSIQQETQQC